MLFNSLSYAIFLPVVCIVYYLLPHRMRWAALLAFSLHFFMSWNPRLIPLILFTTLVSWSGALALDHLRRRRARQAVVVAGSALCLAVLFFFKYYDFAADSLQGLFGLLGIPLAPPTLSLLLPVGVSFYTFQTLSYLIDVWRGDLSPERIYLTNIERINRFAEKMARRGVTVVFAFAPLDELAVTGSAEETAAFGRAVTEALEIPVILDLPTALLPGAYFYDSNNHLTSAGAQINIQNLIDGLREVLADEAQ